jgi:DNA-binding NarL/FixJ family response regulator
MALLAGTVEQLDAGIGGVIHIVGEAGIGKSRLLAEARELSGGAGHLVLSGRATEFERDYPFAAFVDALDPFFDADPAEWIDDLGRERAHELAAILPSLAFRDGEAPAVSQAERFRAYDAARVLLERLGERRPLVLALDDLHWSDAASIELISHLLRRPPRGPVLILMAYRPPHASPQLATVLEAAQRNSSDEHLSEVLELGPLSSDECELLLGSQLDGATRERLCRDSGGNPFYLEQLARTAGKSVASAGGSADSIDRSVPVAVAASIAGELEVLSDGARELLSAAAVVGEPFDPALAAAVANLPEAEALEGIDELSAADLVRPTAVAREFRFRHPILRRAVYESAPPGWRINAHRAAASALRERGAPAYDRAHHVEQYAAPGDLEAIDVLEEAGHAVAARAPGPAANWFEAGLRLVPPGHTYKARRIELLIPMAIALGAVGRLEESSEALRKVLELWSRGPSTERAGVVWFAALLEMLQANPARAETMLLDSLWELPDAGSSDATRMKCGLALSAYFKADWEQMARWSRRALEEGRDLPPADRANASAALALAEYGRRHIGAARAHAEKAAELVDRLPDEQLAQRAEAIVFLGWAQHALGHNREVVHNMDRAIALARDHGQGHLMASTFLIKGAALAWRGELAAAAAACDSAVQTALLSSDALFSTWAFQTACWVEILRGDLQLAVQHGEQAMATGASIASPWSTMPPWLLAAAWLELGEVERARELLFRSGKGPELSPFPMYAPGSFETLTRLELQSGNLEQAEKWSREAEQAGEELGVGVQLAEGRRAGARVLLAAGRWEEAAERALSSVAAAEEVESPVEAARSRLIAGRALAEGGSRDVAVGELSSAAAQFSACGALRLRDEAAAELRRLGERVAPAIAPAANGNGVLGLTSRQLEVAQLVTSGKTNREIAARLFLSEKGVESHLRRIFDKLDVSSRAALAAMVERSHSNGEH